MKRITAIFLAIAAVLALASCGAKPTNQPSAGSETDLTAAQEPSAAVSGESEADATGAWAAAYREYLLRVLPEILENEYVRANSSYLRFGFMDLNEDNVPELWYNDDLGAHGPNYVILTCRDGEVAEVGDGFTVLDYYEKQGVFCFTASGGAAGYETTYYRMTDDGCEQLDVYEEYLDTSVAPDENGDMTVVRHLNDADVSEEEHQAFLEQYTACYGQAVSVDTEDGFPLTEDSILANCR